MIDVQVCKSHGDFSLDVSLQTTSGIVGIFGPSGAGKSTLINLIAGLDQPTTGHVTVKNETYFNSAEDRCVPIHKRQIGLVFQDDRLFPHMSVKKNLLYGATTNTADLDQIASLLEITSLLDRSVTKLSGGERQRVAIGRALMSQPQLLILDEPLAALDVRLRQHILGALRKIHDTFAIPMLYVSHELHEILQLTDELLLLNNGTVAGHGTFNDLIHTSDALAVLHQRGLTNVITATVQSHNTNDGLTTLQLGKEMHTTVVAPLTHAPVDTQIQIAIKPTDVAIANNRIKGVSIQNQVVGTIRRCSTHDRRAMIETDIGTPLIIEVSRRSVNALQLCEGSSITCLIKSHAISYLNDNTFARQMR